jgi:hypothetical protein
MTDEIKPEEEIIEDIFSDETEEIKPTEGDGVESLSSDALAEYNKKVGKDYKSWDDVTKREKEVDKAFARGEHKKEEPKKTESINDEVVEELLLSKHPEAEHILDDLKETAKLKGVSVLKLYRESKYYQGEAKSISDAKKVEEENKSKIKSPSNGTPPPKSDILATKPEDVSKLKPSEKAEWLKAQANKERMSTD